jgi:hypothetical protein
MQMADSINPWRRHRLLQWAGFVAVVFIVLASASVVTGWVDLRSHAFEIVVVAWMVICLSMLVLAHEAKCPQCAQRFYAKGGDFFQFSKKCMHCGQIKYAEIGRPGN